MLRVWYCTNFAGHYPVGAAAVVVAKDQEQAAAELWKLLEHANLAESNRDCDPPLELIEIQLTEPGGAMLVDGNY